MSCLIDTDIVAEVGKGARCDPSVAAWWASVGDEDLFPSPPVLGEIRKGVALACREDPAKAGALDSWLAQGEPPSVGRWFPVDTAVAEERGRLSAARPVPVVHGLMATTAKANGPTFVTRNEADVADPGATILDPFR